MSSRHPPNTQRRTRQRIDLSGDQQPQDEQINPAILSMIRDQSVNKGRARDRGDCLSPRDFVKQKKLFLRMLQPSPIPLYQALANSGLAANVEDPLKLWKDYAAQVLGPNVQVAELVRISKDPTTGIYFGKFGIQNKTAPNIGVNIAYKVIQSQPARFDMTPCEGFLRAGAATEVSLRSNVSYNNDEELSRKIGLSTGFLVLTFPVPFDIQLNESSINAIWRAYGSHLLPPEIVQENLIAEIVPEGFAFAGDFNMVEDAMMGMQFYFPKRADFPSPNYGIPMINQEAAVQIYNTWFPMDKISPEEIAREMDRKVHHLHASMAIMTGTFNTCNYKTKLLHATAIVCVIAVVLAFMTPKTYFDNWSPVEKGLLIDYLVPQEPEPEPEQAMTWGQMLWPGNWY